MSSSLFVRAAPSAGRRLWAGPQPNSQSFTQLLRIHRLNHEFQSRGGSNQAASSSSSSNQGAPPTYSSLGDEEVAKIDTYLDVLLDWNANKMNLTGMISTLYGETTSSGSCRIAHAITREANRNDVCLPAAVKSREEAITRHVDDSLALLPALDTCADKDPSTSHLAPATAGDGERLRLIDIGSGAGLPGLVIATVRPAWKVYLLDSLKKRCMFNEYVAEAMGLDNVEIIWARAEDAARDATHRETYHIATARAVAELRVLAELCLPFVQKNGHWIAAKGHSPIEEVQHAQRAISMLGGGPPSLEEVESMAPEGKRTAVIVQKKKPCAPTYPRRPGIPKKQPL